MEKPDSDELTHLDARGQAHMVDVGGKATTERTAVAVGFLRTAPDTLQLLRAGKTPKGDVLATARVAGIQAAKKTPDLIPMCHAIALTSCKVDLKIDDSMGGIAIRTTTKACDRTGVEMEALTAASVAGLTLYDMLKAVDKSMVLETVKLESKTK